MPRMIRTLLAALVVTLVWAGAAQAVISGQPAFTLSPFTKAQAGAGNAVALTMLWGPPQFLSNGADDHQEVILTELPLGSPQKFTAGKTASSLTPLFVGNGRPYRTTVAACEQASCVLGSINTAEATGTTMIDATPPTGTVVLNGGAPATNDRTVTLGLAATDPLIEGRPGTSSGVTQFAIDIDGDGTFPCGILIGSDFSGCAQTFAGTGSATVPAGDGVKTVGVLFGDGARAPSVPCTTPFCAVLLGNPILGNVSTTPATDTILLDTVKPTAVATLDRTSVERGASVSFSSAASTDPGGAVASGIDPAATSWEFADGTPPAAGATVAHTFSTVGTFIGRLLVRDRAGNVSGAGAFTVVVGPRAGETVSGSGSVAGVSGTAGFSVSRLRVKAKYVRSRLKGSVTVAGASTLSGRLRLVVRRGPRGKVLRAAASTIGVAPFTKTLTLPSSLRPGRYTLALAGPGGTLSSVLTLKPPREGVIASGKITRPGPRARATFRFAARPVAGLRGTLRVVWSQGRRTLGVVRVGSGAAVRAALPAGSTVTRGPLRAVLRARTTVIGSAAARVR